MILNAIKQMERASRADADVVSLAQGIPFKPSDKHIRQAAIEAIMAGKADQYSDPQGIPELREAVITTLQEQGMQYTADEVLVTAGAIEGLATVLHVVISPSRQEVIMPVPVYSAYSRSVELAGGVVVPIRLDENAGWDLDIELVRKAITTHTTAILICNPNNPTGSVYPEQTVRALADLAAEHDIILVSDEVYGNMLYDDAECFSPAMLPEHRKHVVRIVSFSKDFSLTGWRIGFLHADKSRIDKLVATHDTLVNCAPVVSQYAAVEAIAQRTAIVAANAVTYERHRQIMAGYLDKLSPWVSYTMPTGAYFFFVRLRGVPDSTAFCMDLLTQQKLATVPGVDFGLGGEGHIRLCFGRSAGAIHEGMQRLSRYIMEENI